ncbi:hypothetical protein QOT17_006129 [Balamuthia mandrillaris]
MEALKEGLAALRPTQQIVQVLRQRGQLNRRDLWNELVRQNTSIRSKFQSKKILRWLLHRNRVQKVSVEGQKRLLFKVNEENEAKAQRKKEQKRKYVELTQSEVLRRQRQYALRLAMQQGSVRRSEDDPNTRKNRARAKLEARAKLAMQTPMSPTSLDNASPST